MKPQPREVTEALLARGKPVEFVDCIRQQNQIVSDALELGQTVASLQALTIEGEQALKENLFGLDAAETKFQKFSATTEEARYHQLPFPMAVVQRKIKNAPNNTQKFSLLIQLFEVVVRFIDLVHLADYINNRKQAVLVTEHERVRKALTEDLWRYLFVLYIDRKGGLNMRNDLAHGVARKNMFNRAIADRVVHGLLVLSLIRSSEKNKT